MKIAIGYKIHKDSWGGGNQFVTSLNQYAKSNGHEIVYELKDKNIDIILIVDPRSYEQDIPFSLFDIFKYLLFTNKNAIVVHRINECDERKNTKYMNMMLRRTNFLADHTVFIASWLRNLKIYQKDKSCSVILNGANTNFFNSSRSNFWNKKSPLKIVTHHWSCNFNKGFDIYEKLDRMLTSKKWMDKIRFTYIGNIPSKYNFCRTRHLLPIHGDKLGIELSKHHVYLTASLNEPSGNHHIEAAQCGLPLLYIDSGGIPEYCEGFGISFNKSNFESKLNEMIEDYKIYVNNIGEYSLNSEKMSKNYENLFNDMLSNKDDVINRRKKLKLNIIERFLYKTSRRIDKFFNAIYLKYFDSKFD